MNKPLAHSINIEGRTHPLHEHAEAVATLAEKFARLFGSSGYARCAGLWHDLGKNAPGFQERLAIVADAHVEGSTGYGDHATAGALHAMSIYKERGLGIPLAFTIAGHHGGLADKCDLFLTRLKAADKHERLREAMSNPSAVIPPPPPSLALPTFLHPTSVNDRKGALRRYEFWVRMLFSCLVDADFLDTEAHFDGHRAGSRGGYPRPTDLLGMFNSHMATFGNDGKVNEVRWRVRADCHEMGRSSPRGVFTLTGPTGCGKTLAGMGFALEHAVTHGLDRVVVVIPFTSIIDQNAEVYRKVFGRQNVIDHHASLDPKKETGRNRIACENWDAPIIVTTSVQFVESLFANKTSRCRKLHNVVNSVVIFDEVQTLPIGHLAPILDVLKELVANYKVSLVLSTATQPALKYRQSLTCGFEKVTEIVSDVPGTFAELKRVKVNWPSDLTTPIQWPDLAAKLLRHEEVLCVVHKRADARELAELVPGSIHLSALMCPAHRLKVIGEIKRLLTENRELRERGKAIRRVRLISTQLIEAGVDLDFPVVYRAAGGLDAIAQAAGRCNREGSMACGQVHVFVAPTQPPPGTPRLGLAVTRAMIGAEPSLDPLDPARFDRFFREVYFLHSDHDEKGVQELREGWKFQSVAEAFEMIDDDGEAIVVPYGEAISRLAEVRNFGPSRDRLRALQPYVVNLYAIQSKALEEAGAVETVGDCVRAILMPGYQSLYSDRFGLMLGGPIQADPGSLITEGER
jgi:CRISPR-associated endonuclease/helicase Cas3